MGDIDFRHNAAKEARSDQPHWMNGEILSFFSRAKHALIDVVLYRLIVGCIST
jgi:hypothetical protein